jgi:hypothetical protein
MREITLVPLTWPYLNHSLTQMDVNLDREQRAQLELISMHVGRPPAQVLLDAALFLLSRDLQSLDLVASDASADGSQNFLSRHELDARFTQMLRR